MLREEITNLSQHLIDKNDESKKIFIPSINSDLERLISLITQQKNDNFLLNKQLNELTKEKSIMEQNILAFQGRIQILEEIIGHYY